MADLNDAEQDAEQKARGGRPRGAPDDGALQESWASGPDKTLWTERLVVAAVTLAFAAAAASFASWDQPFGDGWNRYLGNAIAIREHDWGSYLRWRGPVHAWLILGILPLAGSLVRASQLLSFGCATLTLPLTWAVGRQLLGSEGRWTSIIAVLLLASWPDLRLFARFSSPYALDAVLLAGAAWFCLGALGTLSRTGVDHAKPHGFAALGRREQARAANGMCAAGCMLGVGIATDYRFLPLTGALALGAGLASVEMGRRAWWIALGMVAIALPIGFGLIATVPVQLYSLGEQVALQRDMAASVVKECARRGPVSPQLVDAFGACGRALLHLNLQRAGAALVVPAEAVAAVVVLGLVARRPKTLWRRIFLVLPLLPLLPSLLVIAIQHRYLVPVAPFAALLVACGLIRLEGYIRLLLHKTGRADGLGAMTTLLLVAVAGFAWSRSASTLMSRFNAHHVDMEGVAPADAAVAAAGSLLAGWKAGDRVLDCANGNLEARIYPIPVERRAPVRGAVPSVCAALLARPPSERTWMLVRDDASHAGWTPEHAETGPGMRLLHGDPADSLAPSPMP